MITRHEQKPILLTGANGQVGFELARSLQGLGHLVALDRGALDLSDSEQIRRIVRELSPMLIVNAAAYTAVDAAENDVAAAMRLNAEAPDILAQEAKRLGALLVHYSTDYVFDGTKDEPYEEDDAANPLNVYGKSKLAGEQAIAASGCAHLILRTSWVYGARGKNFLRTMLQLGAQREELSMVADQIGAPTWSRTIATLTSNVLAQLLVQDRDEWLRCSGIYHLTASGATSWCGFAQAIFDTSTLANKPVIKAIPTAAWSDLTTAGFPAAAVRPKNSRLSNQKLFATFGLTAPDWREALELCMADGSLNP
ncbi:dTDP-4-dehydrorhamnose reductase [Caballeronia sp. SBC2]|uniref:dTDP-4-dehydrorhamnose reductase n=1 Tax=Caballeronia sp. SBC2 TaxID=2705547 RepID=UPI0013E19F4D|nr:dTDP-4-dehydrorhamnose reductase [Caballeronia sp. SBC2]QIE24859.1 dTDP-4-dehydrorhamnose reductase [Caballeronia sp. SBC2]